MTKLLLSTLLLVLALPAWASYYEQGVGNVESEEIQLGHFYVEHYTSINNRPVQNRFSIMYDSGDYPTSQTGVEKFQVENEVCQKYYQRPAKAKQVIMHFTSVGSGADLGDVILNPLQAAGDGRHWVSQLIQFSCL